MMSLLAMASWLMTSLLVNPKEWVPVPTTILSHISCYVCSLVQGFCFFHSINRHRWVWCAIMICTAKNMEGGHFNTFMPCWIGLTSQWGRWKWLLSFDRGWSGPSFTATASRATSPAHLLLAHSSIDSSQHSQEVQGHWKNCQQLTPPVQYSAKACKGLSRELLICPKHISMNEGMASNCLLYFVSPAKGEGWQDSFCGWGSMWEHIYMSSSVAGGSLQGVCCSHPSENQAPKAAPGRKLLLLS